MDEMIGNRNWIYGVGVQQIFAPKIFYTLQMRLVTTAEMLEAFQQLLLGSANVIMTLIVSDKCNWQLN